jgi:hypothetical protein
MISLEPFYKSWTELLKLEVINIKWISIKILIITLLSYLLGAYRIFIIALPVYILTTIYFTYIILVYNETFFLYVFGDEKYKSYDIELRKEYLKNNKDSIKLLSWIIWISHIIPLILFIIWYNRIKDGKININMTDNWLFLRKNMLLITVFSILLCLVLLLTTSRNLYGLNEDEPYFILFFPILIFIIVVMLY